MAPAEVAIAIVFVIIVVLVWNRRSYEQNKLLNRIAEAQEKGKEQ